LKKAVALCVVLCGASFFAARAHLTSVTKATNARPQTRAAGDLSKWRPARDNSGVGYVGGAVCAECHKKEAATQASTPMGHAAARAGALRAREAFARR
jgi:hypothetical protein